MIWRAVLLGTVVLAVVLAGVGLTAQTQDIATGEGCVSTSTGEEVNQARCEDDAGGYRPGTGGGTGWSRSYEKQDNVQGGPLSDEAAPLWFFAAGAALLIGLASLPLLRARERRKD